MANTTMFVVMMILYSFGNYQAASSPISTSSLYSLPSLSAVSQENLKTPKEAPEESSTLMKVFPFAANINEYISEENLFSESLNDVSTAEEVIPDTVFDLIKLFSDSLNDVYEDKEVIPDTVFNFEETPEQEENMKQPMQRGRMSQFVFEDPDYSNTDIEYSFYPSYETTEIPAIVISDISTQFQNFKDLNPTWVWAIIICVIALSLIGLVYMFIICLPCNCCQKTKPSDHIQSLSFQTLQDFNSRPGPLSINIDANNSKTTENRRNNRIGSINLYNIGYDYIYMNNDKDYLMSTPKPKQKAPKQMFKTTYLPNAFKQQRKSSKNNFKHMDELLQAYYSLDITQ